MILRIHTDIVPHGISSLTQKSHNACVWLVQEISRSTRATACVCHPAENTRRSRQLRAFDFSPFGRRPKGSCDAALSRDLRDSRETKNRDARITHRLHGFYRLIKNLF